MAKDYYEILGVSREANQDAIKKAYRKLALQFHPDKNPGDQAAEDKFKEAAQAYEVLGNQEKRARYDRFGHAGVNGGFGGAGAGGFHDVSDIFEAFGDVFGDFFGGAAQQGRGRSRGRRARRGADLRYVLEVNLKEVVQGAKKTIKFEVEGNCKACEGSGAKKGTQPETCGTCGGHGQVVRQQGFFSMATTCPTCRGTGQIIKDPCEVCHGQGRVMDPRELAVNVPPGVDNGTQLRLSGEGEEGSLGGPSGDLYVEIRVKEHPRFARQDLHLITPLEISYLQALLGAEIEVEGLLDSHKVKVEPGTSHGDLLRVEGEGVPALRGGRGLKGDLIFDLRVKMPKKLKKDEEKALREIARQKGEAVLEAKKGFFGSLKP